MRIVLLGGTRGLGRAVARRAAARGDALFLLGRDESSLARSAADLEARGARAPVRWGRADLREPDGFDRALLAADRELGGVDAVVLTAGVFATEADLGPDPDARRQLREVNATSAAAFADAAADLLAQRGGGTVCVFGSVAGDRIRPSIATYAASKAALAAHVDALELRARPRGVHVLLVKPGFVRTDMTEGLQPPPFATDPDQVARVALAAMAGRARVAYAPRWLRLPALVLRLLPRALVRRMRG